jgi:hypothetical protein
VTVTPPDFLVNVPVGEQFVRGVRCNVLSSDDGSHEYCGEGPEGEYVGNVESLPILSGVVIDGFLGS